MRQCITRPYTSSVFNSILGRTQASFLAERTGMSATRLRAPLELQGMEDELLRDFGAPGDASVAFTFDCESILACPCLTECKSYTGRAAVGIAVLGRNVFAT